MKAALWGLAAGGAAALALAAGAACRAPMMLMMPRLSGTCDGACDHYFDCRGGGESHAAHGRCVADCRDVFSDDESLRAFESLSCEDAVEFVEGTPARAAGPARPTADTAATR